MVQKTLSAKNLSNAQGATLLCGWIKVLPLFLIVIPGMIARVLYPDEIGCVDPEICQAICQNPVSCSNIAYPRLVLGKKILREFWTATFYSENQIFLDPTAYFNPQKVDFKAKLTVFSFLCIETPILYFLSHDNMKKKFSTALSGQSAKVSKSTRFI